MRKVRFDYFAVVFLGFCSRGVFVEGKRKA